VTDSPNGEQLAVLRLLARGLDHPQIAKQLGITVDQSRRHLRDAMQDLHATNATHAVTLAIGHQLLPADVATQSNS
jgi:DNA-binding NarL/FixJ family response regulator